MMDRVSRAFMCFLLTAVLFLLSLGWGWGIARAENYYLVIYTDGAASLDSLTAAQKTELAVKYVPPAVQASSQWAAATSAQKWAYVKEECLPPRLMQKIQQEGMLPILRDANDKLEIVEQYWKLASEGTKHVFMLYLDLEGDQARALKNWLDKQVGAGFRYWYGRTMCDVLKDMWSKRADNLTAAVGKRVIKYPTVVLDSETGQNVTKYVPLGEAMAAGVTIDPKEITDNCRDALLPRKIFDGSK